MTPLAILPVADEASQRQLLRDFLAQEGHQVAAAASGAEAPVPGCGPKPLTSCWWITKCTG